MSKEILEQIHIGSEGQVKQVMDNDGMSQLSEQEDAEEKRCKTCGKILLAYSYIGTFDVSKYCYGSHL